MGTKDERKEVGSKLIAVNNAGPDESKESTSKHSVSTSYTI